MNRKCSTSDFQKIINVFKMWNVWAFVFIDGNTWFKCPCAWDRINPSQFNRGLISGTDHADHGKISQLAGQSKMQFWIHHKKDEFFLHNFFIWCLKVQKSNVVLTEYCQIYGLPLTPHVISGQNWEVEILPKITWDVNGSP